MNAWYRRRIVPLSLFFGLGLCSVSGVSAQPTRALCKPIEAATFPERIHVRCQYPIAGFVYFAASAAEPRFASRALSVMEAAQVSDKVVLVGFDPTDTLSGPVFGCAVADCRPLLSIVLVENPPPPAPGRCEVNPNDIGCPAYCTAHDDMNCEGYCRRHPQDPDCALPLPDRCDRYPRAPGCQNPPRPPALRH